MNSIVIICPHHVPVEVAVCNMPDGYICDFRYTLFANYSSFTDGVGDKWVSGLPNVGDNPWIGPHKTPIISVTTRAEQRRRTLSKSCSSSDARELTNGVTRPVTHRGSGTPTDKTATKQALTTNDKHSERQTDATEPGGTIINFDNAATDTTGQESTGMACTATQPAFQTGARQYVYDAPNSESDTARHVDGRTAVSDGLDDDFDTCSKQLRGIEVAYNNSDTWNLSDFHESATADEFRQ